MCSTPHSLFVATKKNKFFPVHAMKAHKGSRSLAPLILNMSLDGGELSTLRNGRFYLFSRLYNVSISSSAHVAII